MPDSRVTIHECSFKDRVCENYTCRQATPLKKKYFIGNPHAHGQKPIFCEDCIRHLVGNLPAEFVPGAGDQAATIRTELQKEFDEKANVIRREAREDVMKEIMTKYEAAASKQVQVETEAEAEPEVEPEDDQKPVYRCLDCGKEFDTPQKLGAHRKAHKGE